MEGADQRLSEDCLIVLQRGVGDDVEQLRHQRTAELLQGGLAGMRTRIVERAGEIVEDRVGLLEEGGRVEGLHCSHPLNEVERPMRND